MGQSYLQERRAVLTLVAVVAVWGMLGMLIMERPGPVRIPAVLFGLTVFLFGVGRAVRSLGRDAARYRLPRCVAGLPFVETAFLYTITGACVAVIIALELRSAGTLGQLATIFTVTIISVMAMFVVMRLRRRRQSGADHG